MKEYDFDENNFNSICEALSKNCNLKYITLDSDKIVGYSKLANSLTKNTNLKYLKIREEHGNIDEIDIFINIMCKNNTLKLLELCVSGYKFYKNLVKYLSTNTSLEKLIIMDTSTDDIKICKYLAKSIENNFTLKYLCCGNNDKNFNVKYLSRSLIINNTLEILDLYCLTIRSENIFYLVDILEKNKSLKYIKLLSVNQDCCNNIIKSLKNNVTLEKIEGVDVGDMLSPEKIAERRNKLLTKSSRK